MKKILQKKKILGIVCGIILLLPSFKIANAVEGEYIITCPSASVVPPSNRGKRLTLTTRTDALGLCCVPFPSGADPEWAAEDKIAACVAALQPSIESGFSDIELQEETKSKLQKIPFETIPALINFYIKGLLPFVGIWALIFFVFGGIIWLTSGGNPDKIKKAQQMMVWATIGIVFIFASYTIVSRIIPAVGG